MTYLRPRICRKRVLVLSRQSLWPERRERDFGNCKAALSMYHLDLKLGNSDPSGIAEIYSSFTEGFETAELKYAENLFNCSARVMPQIHDAVPASLC